jgi:hypothetical protein
VATTTAAAYDAITSGRVIWETDGRHGRPDHLTYREAVHATYEGPYTLGKQYAWDGLVGNTTGLVGNHPELGFDLTMPAGQAEAGSYTTRDFASAPHGVDYRAHYADWEQDHSRHPNLLLPGRTARFIGARIGALALGDQLLGTGGCCVQDWVGLDFPTMEVHGNTAKSEYTGGGFCWLPSGSRLARIGRVLGRRRDHPFTQSRPGVAPLLVMLARDKGFVKARAVHLDPDVPHEFAAHWTPDAAAIQMWVDGELVMTVREGTRAVPTGLATRGRVRFSHSGFHLCCWQDNGAGTMDVQGAAGHPDRDQPYTIERLEVVDV